MSKPGVLSAFNNDAFYTAVAEKQTKMVAGGKKGGEGGQYANI